MADHLRKPWLQTQRPKSKPGDVVVVGGRSLTYVATVPFFRLGELLSDIPQASLRSGLERMGYVVPGLKN